MNIGDLQITNLCVGDIPALSACVGTELVWSGGSQPGPQPVYSAMPLTFEVTSPGIIMVGANNLPRDRVKTGIEIDVYKNDSYLSTINTNISIPNTGLTVDQATVGDIYEFKGVYGTATPGTSDSTTFTFCGTTIGFNMYGNIFSLVDTDFANRDAFSATTSGRGPITGQAEYYTFAALFKGCTGLTSAEHLYLGNDTVPNCFRTLFRDCWSLQMGPVLPAPEPAQGAYTYLFRYCTGLSQITCVLTGSPQDITTNWVDGVSATGTFIKHPNATWPTGTSGIPSGWTVQNAVV